VQGFLATIFKINNGVVYGLSFKVYHFDHTTILGNRALTPITIRR